jgi:hypothetical protein
VWYTNGRSKGWQFGGGGSVVVFQGGQSHCGCRDVVVQQGGIVGKGSALANKGSALANWVPFWSSLDVLFTVHVHQKYISFISPEKGVAKPGKPGKRSEL